MTDTLPVRNPGGKERPRDARGALLAVLLLLSFGLAVAYLLKGGVSRPGAAGAIARPDIAPPEPAENLLGGPQRPDSTSLPRFSEKDSLPATDSPSLRRRYLTDVTHAHEGGTDHRHGEDGRSSDGHRHTRGGEADELPEDAELKGANMKRLAEIGGKLRGATGDDDRGQDAGF